MYVCMENLPNLFFSSTRLLNYLLSCMATHISALLPQTTTDNDVFSRDSQLRVQSHVSFVIYLLITHTEYTESTGEKRDGDSL